MARTILTLPYPPSVNHWWMPVIRVNPHTRKLFARLILSDAATRYKAEAEWEILAQRPQPCCWPYTQPVTLRIVATPPQHTNRRVGDIDNLCKACADVLVTWGVLQDDSLVRELHVYQLPPHDQGKLVVTVLPWSAGRQQRWQKL